MWSRHTWRCVCAAFWGSWCAIPRSLGMMWRSRGFVSHLSRLSRIRMRRLGERQWRHLVNCSFMLLLSLTMIIQSQELSGKFLSLQSTHSCTASLQTKTKQSDSMPVKPSRTSQLSQSQPATSLLPWKSQLCCWISTTRKQTRFLKLRLQCPFPTSANSIRHSFQPSSSRSALKISR